MWAIAEVCQRTGLSPRTVRYYEEIGLLPGVRRSEGGRRVYGADELERLSFITRLKTLGLSLKEIRELNAVYAIGGSTEAMLAHLRGLLDAHLADADRRLQELGDLRRQLVIYREHIDARLDEPAAAPAAPVSKASKASGVTAGSAATARPAPRRAKA
jgi:DNA-binding transcriptional MerR regulator